MPKHTHQIVYSGSEATPGWLPQGKNAMALINGATTTAAIGNGVFQDRGINYEGAYIGDFTALQSTGGSAAHNNLQPYLSVFMFKRTS